MQQIKFVNKIQSEVIVFFNFADLPTFLFYRTKTIQVAYNLKHHLNKRPTTLALTHYDLINI